MPLEKQYVEIPLGLGGVNKGRTSAKLVESPGLSDILNAEINKAGDLELRQGYYKQRIVKTGFGDDLAELYRLSTRDDTLVVLGRECLGEYEAETNAWTGTALASSVIATSSRMIYTEAGVEPTMLDLIKVGVYLLIACEMYVGGYSGDCYIYVYNTLTDSIIARLTITGARRIKLAVVNGAGLAIYKKNADGNIYISKWNPATRILSSLSTHAGFDTADYDNFDVAYDESYLYIAGQSSTANQVRVIRTGDDGVADYTQSWASGSGNYDVVSITKHTTADAIMVVTSNSTSTVINTAVASTGAFAYAGTATGYAGAVKACGYSCASTFFMALLEYDNATSTARNRVTAISKTTTSNSYFIAGSINHAGLAHKTLDNYSGSIRVGLIRSNGMSPQIHEAELREYATGDLDCYINGIYGQRTARQEWNTGAVDNYHNNVCGVSNASVNGDVYFAFVQTYRSIAVSSSLTVYSSGIAIGKYTLDNNKRAISVCVQNCLYISGGHMFVWDGLRMFPCGFTVPPEIVSLTASTTGGLTPSTTYSYVACYEYVDRYGQIHRSAPSLPMSITLGVGEDSVYVVIRTCADKWNYIQGACPDTIGTIVIYRTVGNGTLYHLACKAADNCDQIDASDRTVIDTISDAVLAAYPYLYTTGGVMDNDPPPPTECLCYHKNRLWVVDSESGDICYSKEIVNGEGVSFSYANRVQTGSAVNAPIALVSMDDNLIVFWDDKIGVVCGDGCNDLGQGSTLTTPRTVSPEGLAPDERRSVVVVPDGIMYKSHNGIKLLDRSLQVQDIGHSVVDYTDSTVTGEGASIVGASYNASKHQTLFTLAKADDMYSARILAYDHLLAQWYTHKVFLGGVGVGGAYPVDSYQHGANHYILGDDSSAGTYPIVYSPGASAIYYDYDSTNKLYYAVLTPWIKLNGIQGYGRIYRAWLLGERVGAHDIYINIYYDYNTTSPSYITVLHPATNITPYQIKFGIPNQHCQAIRMEIGVMCDDGSAANALAKLTSLRLEYGVDARAARIKNVYG